MKEDFSELKNTIAFFVDKNYLPVIKGRLKDQRIFIEKCRNEFGRIQNLINNPDSESENQNISKAILLNERIKQLISDHFVRDDKVTVQKYFPDLTSTLDLFLAESPETIIEIQDNERFIINPNDRFDIKLRKPLKKIFLSISNVPISISNLFRKLFKKPLKENKTWKRTVYLRKLRTYFFYYELVAKLLDVTREYYLQRSKVMKQLWEAYESLDAGLKKQYLREDEHSENQLNNLDFNSVINSVQSELSVFENSLSEKINLIIDPIFQEYQDRYIKAGTIEYPKGRLSKRILEKQNKKLIMNFNVLFNGWENNFTALGDDWQMNNELYLIMYSTYSQSLNHKRDFQNNIEKNLLPLSLQIISKIRKYKESIEAKSSKMELQSIYSEIKKSVTEDLTDELIPKFINTLTDQNLTGIVAELDNVVLEHINNVKASRTLVSTDEYNEEIKESDIHTFSPKEILEYSAAPKFFGTTNKLKNEINNQIFQIQNDVSEIDHIAEFSIDSAINKLLTEDSIEESVQISLEGINRTLNKLVETEGKLNRIQKQFDDDITTASKQFFTELKNLTQTEKIFAIRLNLAKAKALQKSRQVKKQFVENLKNVIPQLTGLVKKLFHKISEQYEKLRENLGLTPGAKVIASEISDYLAETQTAVLRLPFVYQRLFEITPLDDKRFFFGREAELLQLKKALQNWQANKFAPTIIVAEKGSGATSLITNFISSENVEFSIIRHSINYPVYKNDLLLELFSEILGVEKFSSVDNLIEHLNSLPDKQIFVIENLQRMFLRKVDGFNVLKTFFEIISKTNRNIFWITTCTLYSWKYLDKTIHAPDFFGYIVNLKDLSDEQITKLVSKRHRVSGYNIFYEPKDDILKSKSYRKLPEEERQSYLEKKYFIELNNFAQSNISLALLFWLRSAKEVVNDVIKIGSPPDLDYSFLENLSSEKVFALSTLLMHDGLTIEHLAEIFNITSGKSKLILQLMYDDGIIVRSNELYIINPLLYRQIVGLLKSKNIIH